MSDRSGEMLLLYDDGHIYLFCPRCGQDEPLDSDAVATLAGAISAAEAHRCEPENVEGRAATSAVEPHDDAGRPK